LWGGKKGNSLVMLKKEKGKGVRQKPDKGGKKTITSRCEKGKKAEVL